jgi:hypothetical protein
MSRSRKRGSLHPLPHMSSRPTSSAHINISFVFKYCCVHGHVTALSGTQQDAYNKDSSRIPSVGIGMCIIQPCQTLTLNLYLPALKY